MVRKRRQKNPRILVVTPEISYIPRGMGNMASMLTAKAGGLADVSAALVGTLFDQGADVHVALPHYRRMFHVDIGRLFSDELRLYMSRLPNSRLHLAEDRVFYYRDTVYGNYDGENPRLALAFEREVINNIIPTVNPDLIHCNDWMTGLIPAYARRLGIPCLFTLHNVHSQKVTLAMVEDAGIDAAGFWRNLFFSRMPANYEETRDSNPVDLLVSGVFASHFINTVSPGFLREIVSGLHAFVPDNLRAELTQKYHSGCASGILNAPDPTYSPLTDPALTRRYGTADHVAGKRANKLELQHRLGLAVNPDAPLFFWPSRLDPMQKGPQLLAEILYDRISVYWPDQMQVVFVANGPYQGHFRDIVHHHGFYDRVAVCDFDEDLSRQAYAAADFLLMPSLFEPCGLPQMIGCLYGTLPVVNDTGGLHDTIERLEPDRDRGNGFVFQVYDAQGLRWGMDEAMRFYRLPADARAVQVSRVMDQGMKQFNHDVCAKAYIDIYERMTERPLVRDVFRE